jgi:hypothetical protein
VDRIYKYIWLLIWLAPFVVIESWYENLSRFSNLLRTWQISSYVAVNIFAILLEFAVIRLVVGSLKRIHKPSVLRRLIPILSLSFVAVVVAANSISWIVYYFTNAFPSLDQIVGLIRTTDIYFLLFMAVQTSDGWLLVFSLLWIGLLSALTYFLCPALSTRDRRKSAALEVAFAFVVLAAWPIILRAHFGTQLFEVVAPVVKTSISPSLSLWAFELSSLWSRTPEQPLRKLDLSQREAPPSTRSPEAPRYIILLTVEALRRDALSPEFTDPKFFPFLQSLMKNSIVFSHAYANAPETAYSHVGLLTGLHPFRGKNRNLFDDARLNGLTLYDSLKALGYRTAHLQSDWPVTVRFFGKSQIDLFYDQANPDPRRINQWLSPGDSWIYGAPIVPSHHFDRVRLSLARNFMQQEPQAFVALYISATHFAYDWFDDMGTPVAPHTALAEPISFFGYPPSLAPALHQNYLNVVSYVDRELGLFFKQLEDLGLWDSTLIVLTGDHGESFHESGRVTHGNQILEEAVRVPVIFTGGYVKNLKPTMEKGAVVQHLDIPTTLLSLVGEGLTDATQGEVLLTGKRDPESSISKTRPIFLTSQATDYEDAIICYPYKLVRERFSSKVSLYRLTHRGEERVSGQSYQELALKLEQTLGAFELLQLSYFGLAENNPQLHNPPKLNVFTCPDSMPAEQAPDESAETVL